MVIAFKVFFCPGVKITPGNNNILIRQVGENKRIINIKTFWIFKISKITKKSKKHKKCQQKKSLKMLKMANCQGRQGRCQGPPTRRLHFKKEIESNLKSRGFGNVSSVDTSMWNFCCIDCTWKVSLLCVSSCDHAIHKLWCNCSCNGYTWMAFLQYASSSCELSI